VLTRYRKKLIEQRTSELQRLAKVIEDGGLKIDSVVSSLTTESARDMIKALIAGQRDPAVLAQLARGVMRRKIPELEMACEAGSPLPTARCVGSTWTPTTISPARSPPWTGWSPRQLRRSGG
jgi:hypothetical protein